MNEATLVLQCVAPFPKALADHLLCPKCGRPQRSTCAFREHARKVHGITNVDTLTICSACGKTFTQFKPASTHFSRCKSRPNHEPTYEPSTSEPSTSEPATSEPLTPQPTSTYVPVLAPVTPFTPVFPDRELIRGYLAKPLRQMTSAFTSALTRLPRRLQSPCSASHPDRQHSSARMHLST